MNTEIWLEDRTVAWHVEDGVAMLYLATNACADEPLPRQFICDVPPGAALVAPQLSLPAGWALVCSLSHETAIRVDTPDGLDQLDPMAKAGIEDWMKEVIHRLDPKGLWIAGRRQKMRPPAAFGAQEHRVFSTRARAFADIVASEVYARIVAA